jgi:hypothetical protein
MVTSSFVLLVFSLLVLNLVQGKQWNITTDPLPPLQPKECGYETYNNQVYYDVNGKVVLSLQVAGFTFMSYLNQVSQSQAAGNNFGIPIMQFAYSNFTAGTTFLAGYNAQNCTEGEVEGYEPYPGYDYYQSELVALYELGVPIEFVVVILPEYGLCLRYSAVLPWDNPSLPRYLTYTLTFQNSTGYLIEYDLIGTEYCCYDTITLYCPNKGLCYDGSTPQLTYAQTNQSLSNYQIYNESKWSPGFFGNYCPFSSSTSTVTVTSGDDDNSNQVITSYMIALSVITIVLGGALIAMSAFLWINKDKLFGAISGSKVSQYGESHQNPMTKA